MTMPEYITPSASEASCLAHPLFKVLITTQAKSDITQSSGVSSSNSPIVAAASIAPVSSGAQSGLARSMLGTSDLIRDRASRSLPENKSLSEKTFDALVNLKVLTAQYAAHLAPAEQKRLFESLDFMLDPDDWHEEDELPKPASFLDFMKWSIYSQWFNWTSLGLSEEGLFLVAWRTDSISLDASFLGNGTVRWVSRTQMDSGVDVIAGNVALTSFAQYVSFLFRPRETDDEAN